MYNSNIEFLLTSFELTPISTAQLSHPILQDTVLRYHSITTGSKEAILPNATL